jgi:hypothetical protein
MTTREKIPMNKRIGVATIPAGHGGKSWEVLDV